ncbi:MAG: hypothetical protein KTR32_31645 [Granulosicoccus sp.]|nr:hypothetical protein [Granulosicoccus sp.]
MRSVRLIVQLIVLLGFALSAQAAHMAKPEGEILLTITGNIKTTNAEIIVDGDTVPAATFDIDMLEALPVETIRTKSPWTTGVTEFKGVRFDVLLDSIGAQSEHVSLHALDEYSVDIVDGQFGKYPIVLAYEMDGHYMNVRNLGPLWLMYPFDDFPELDTAKNRGHCVWQLIRIEVL